MGLNNASSQLTRALSDGTGLTQEEVKLLIAVAAVASALFGLLRAGVALMDAWPNPGSGFEEKHRAAAHH